MARRSTIKTQVPRPIQDEFNARLVAGGFADYEGLTEWLNERLLEEGLSVRISKTSAFRYGAEFQEQFERDMAEQRQLYQIAKTSLADNQDPEGVVREATIRTMQTRLLRISIALRDAEDAGDDPHLLAETSSKIAKAIADLGRMDIQSQKYKAEVRKQILTEAAQVADSAAKSAGVSEQGRDRIREALGMAV
ncbi:phage protein Gp27 family protein [Methylobacter sp.]|uniref:phage protein Gp27 family protein n=1 Tax=Methylobacter sp. TaxID=2051955 RepID=UPI002489C6DE|nr:phage protein Gp27 family protein [Methylobacter sp.]MDI1278032.1 DUF3486 family protein [Methylobacter sp.]